METIDGIIKFVAGNINGDQADNAIGAATGSASATGDINFWLIACLAIGVVAIGAASYAVCRKWATSRGTHAKSFNNAKFFSIFLAIIVSITLAGSFVSTRFKALAESSVFSMDAVIGTVNTDGIVYSESKITNNSDDDLYIEKLTLTKTNGVDDKDCTWTIKSGDIVMFEGQANGEDVTEIDTLTVNANDSVPVTVTTEGLAPEDAAKIVGFEIAIQVKQEAENATTAKDGAGKSVEEAATETTTSIDNDASLTDAQKTEYKQEIAATQEKTTAEIIASKTKKEVNEAVESGEQAINDIAKAAAKASIENYATAKKAEIDAITGISDDERAAAKNAVDQTLAEAIAAIEESTTQEEINEAVTIAKTKMTITAANAGLTGKYNDYAAKINNLVTLTPAKKAKYLDDLKKAFDEGYAAIGNAGTSEEVSALYTKYSGELDTIYKNAAADRTTTTITLDENGGTAGTMTTVTATYGEALTAITGDLPTKEACNFKGYYDAQSGGTQYYKSDGTAAVEAWDKEAATTTLYAQWTQNYYGAVVLKSETDTTGTALEGASVSFTAKDATEATETVTTAKDTGKFAFTKVPEYTEGEIKITYTPAINSDTYSVVKITTGDKVEANLGSSEIRKLTSLEVTVQFKTGSLATHWCPAFSDSSLSKANVIFYGSDQCEITGSGKNRGDYETYLMSDLNKKGTIYYAFVTTGVTLHCYQTTDVSWNNTFKSPTTTPGTSTSLVDKWNSTGNYCSDTSAKTVYFDGTETEKSQWAPSGTPSSEPTLNGVSYSTGKGSGGWYAAYGGYGGGVLGYYSDMAWSAVASSSSNAYYRNVNYDKWNNNSIVRSGLGAVVLSQVFSNETFDVTASVETTGQGTIDKTSVTGLPYWSEYTVNGDKINLKNRSTSSTTDIQYTATTGYARIKWRILQPTTLKQNNGLTTKTFQTMQLGL